MPVSATAKDTGVSVKKLLPILDLVRGKNVQDAMDTLEFLPSPAAALVARVVKSAASNAEEEIFARPTDLTITKIYANEGPRLKRFRARARGRATQIIKRSSHITVVVDENEEL
jgi:large subunit ribosomal protein L22